MGGVLQRLPQQAQRHRAQRREGEQPERHRNGADRRRFGQHAAEHRTIWTSPTVRPASRMGARASVLGAAASAGASAMTRPLASSTRRGPGGAPAAASVISAAMRARSKRQWSGFRATISATSRASSLASASIVAASRCPAIQ